MNFNGLFIDYDANGRFVRYNRSTSFDRWLEQNQPQKNAELVIFYHARCDDGFGARWAAHQRLSKESFNVTYIPLEHGPSTFNYDTIRNKHVFYVDYCPHKQTFDMVKSIAASVVVIDHHQTARDVLKDECDGVHLFSNDFSGAYLSWVYFSDNDDTFIPKILRHISDNDLWKHEIEGTKEFAAYLRLVNAADYTTEYFDQLNGMITAITSPLQNATFLNPYYVGSKILAQQEEQVAEVMNSAFEYTFPTGEKGKAAYCNIASITSRLGEELAKSSGTFGLVVKVDRTSQLIKCSLRSVGDNCDVAKLAEQYGGGGHKNASGLAVTFEQLDAIYPLTIRT